MTNKNPLPELPDLIEKAEKMRHAVYLVTEEDIAFDIAQTLEHLIAYAKRPTPSDKARLALEAFDEWMSHQISDNEFYKYADHIRAALQSGGVPSADMVFVPRDPTREMIEAGFLQSTFDAVIKCETRVIVSKLYKAMIAAAPRSTEPTIVKELPQMNAEMAADMDYFTFEYKMAEVIRECEKLKPTVEHPDEFDEGYNSAIDVVLDILRKHA